MDSLTRKILWMACLCLLVQTGLSSPAPAVEDEYSNDDNYANDEDEESDREDNYTGPPPEITNSGRAIDVREGQDVLLPCNTKNAEHSALMWRFDSSTLYLDSVKMTKDKRINRYDNNTLAIHHLQPTDSGEYMCQISTIPPTQITFTLTIIAPPKIIRRYPEEPKKIFEKGAALTLTCEATGGPEPVITWKRKGGKPFLNGHHEMTGTGLTFENIDRHNAGVYICTADNKYGSESATFDIVVHYAPEIEITQETITTNVDLEPEITCTVHAAPAATVNWYREGDVVKNSSHIQMHDSQNKHTLIIKGMEKSDFGSYTCFARNKFGTAKKAVILSGAPTRPAVKVSELDGQQPPELKWSVESHLPVKVYQLQYLTDEGNKSIEVSVSGLEGNIYSGVAVLTDIVGGESEVSIRARNDFGWSDPASFKVTNGDGSSGAQTAVVALSFVVISSMMTLLV